MIITSPVPKSIIISHPQPKTPHRICLSKWYISPEDLLNNRVFTAPISIISICQLYCLFISNMVPIEVNQSIRFPAWTGLPSYYKAILLRWPLSSEFCVHTIIPAKIPPKSSMRASLLPSTAPAQVYSLTGRWTGSLEPTRNDDHHHFWIATRPDNYPCKPSYTDFIPVEFMS